MSYNVEAGSLSETSPLVVTSTDQRRLSEQHRTNSGLLNPGVRFSQSGIIEQPPGVSPIICENEESITIRRPVQYHSINSDPVQDERTRAALNRYKYYNKLSAHSDSNFIMPNHMVPPAFFLVIPIKLEGGKQSSAITIFSIWNTMMGTSLLSMPWAIQQAGLATGLSLIVVIAGLCLYTAYRVMNSPKRIPGNSEGMEFVDVAGYYFGRPGTYIAVIFSLVSLLGAAIVYWVLMSNFLYNVVAFINAEAGAGFDKPNYTIATNYSDVICLNPPPLPTPVPTENPNDTAIWSPPMLLSDEHKTTFDKVWQQTLTVPFFLLIILVPLLNFRSPTFFTKFNSLGTLSVLYILFFVIFKATKWGINVDFNEDHQNYVHLFNWSFPALTGTLSLALYIHNCVISIVNNQQHPENNGRDLTIAYICVASTYLIIGSLFYISFPLPKGCIEDNMLNNLIHADILTFVARAFLFFQMVTVFPLLMFIMRMQFMQFAFNDAYPSLLHVMVMNAVILTFCVLFAIFLPKIGTIIRFSGALCGLVYIFALPCLAYMWSQRQEGKLSWMSVLFHCTLIVLGVANFIAQFLIL